jgi:hypothetical protein
VSLGCERDPTALVGGVVVACQEQNSSRADTELGALNYVDGHGEARRLLEAIARSHSCDSVPVDGHMAKHFDPVTLGSPRFRTTGRPTVWDPQRLTALGSV